MSNANAEVYFMNELCQIPNSFADMPSSLQDPQSDRGNGRVRKPQSFAEHQFDALYSQSSNLRNSDFVDYNMMQDRQATTQRIFNQTV